MARILLSAAAGLLALAVSGPAQARGPSHMSGGSSFHPSSSMSRGTSFNRSPSFSRGNFHWTSRCWSGRYGCYCYWCPSASCWYYWCGGQNCYYPISYINAAPPVVTVTPPVVTVTPSVVTTAAGPGGPMPPAGPPLP